MDKKKVLVPYNFTNYDEKALDFVTRRFADDKGVEVTLFNAYTPVPKIELRDSLIIVDLVTDKAFDMVILNRNPGKITRFFTGSVSNKVMKSLKQVDVYVVT